MRRFADALVHILAALLVSAILGELAMRLLYLRSLDFGMEMWKYGAHLKLPVDDPALRFVHRPAARERLMGVDVQISSQGLRDREFSLAKPEGVYRIVLLGDSTTFGWGAPLDGTVAKSLERRLNARGDRRYEVMNFGVGNYGTVQEVRSYLISARQFHPDLVILQYFINDAEPVPDVSSGWLGDHSYLRAYVASRLDGYLRWSGGRPGWESYYRSLYDDRQAGWPPAKAALHDLAIATRQDGARLVVTLLPELHRINNGTYPFQEAHDLVKSVLARDSVPALDLLDALRDQGPESALWVTPLDSHPNAKAADLASKRIADWITAGAATTQ